MTGNCMRNYEGKCVINSPKGLRSATENDAMIIEWCGINMKYDAYPGIGEINHARFKHQAIDEMYISLARQSIIDILKTKNYKTHLELAMRDAKIIYFEDKPVKKTPAEFNNKELYPDGSVGKAFIAGVPLKGEVYVCIAPGNEPGKLMGDIYNSYEEARRHADAINKWEQADVAIVQKLNIETV